MNIKKILKITGGIGALVIVAAGGTGFYANTTWDNGRYSSYPLPDLHASQDSAIIEKGRYLAYGPAHCVECHTPTDGATLSGGFDFTIDFGHMYSPNITPDAKTGIGRYTDPQVARMLRYNVRPHGRAAIPFMQFEGMSDEDLVAVLSFLRSNQPVEHQVPNHDLNLMGKAIAAFLIKPNALDNKAPKTSPAEAATVERGEYLVNSVAECAGCHTVRSMKDGSFVGPRLGGGNEMVSDFDKNILLTPPNLTNDPTGITGKWTEEQFLARFRQGSLVKASIMPWTAFGKMSDDDIRAIYRYIKTVPTVQREVVSVKQKSAK